MAVLFLTPCRESPIRRLAFPGGLRGEMTAEAIVTTRCSAEATALHRQRQTPASKAKRRRACLPTGTFARCTAASSLQEGRPAYRQAGAFHKTLERPHARRNEHPSTKLRASGTVGKEFRFAASKHLTLSITQPRARKVRWTPRTRRLLLTRVPRRR